MTKFIVVISAFCFSTPLLGKSLSAVDFNECIYNYWGSRVKGGVIDAQAAYDLAKANLFPLISGTVVSEDDIVPAPPTGFYTGGNITLTQQLVNLSQWANIHAKKLSEKAAQLDFEDQLLTLMKASTKAYFDYLDLVEKLKLLQKRVSRIEKSVTLSKELNRLRLADSSSIYLAQADKAQLDITITNTQANSQSNLNLLAASIGMGNQKLDLDDNNNPRVNGDISHWSEKIEDLPGIQVLRAKAEAAGATATSVREQRLPALSFSGYYGQLNATEGIAQTNGVGLVLFTLNIPIFDQGMTSIQAQQAESQKSVNESLVFSKREQIMAEVKNLLNQWQVDEKILDLAKGRLENAQHGYDSVVTLFSFGKASFVAVKDSETSLVDSEIQLETIQKKIAEEKTVLQLLDGYSGGKHHPGVGSGKCTLR
jgi:outer membrane protein TolC